MMKTILALDTSTEACSVAVLMANETIEDFELTPRAHTHHILWMIDAVLKRAQCTLKDIDILAVGCGPGSFMGTRLAIGIAQSLALVIPVPVVPVSSLQAVAQATFDRYQTPCVLAGLDARMNEIYYGAYRSQDGWMCAIQEASLAQPNHLIIPQDQSWYFAGTAWETYRTQLPTWITQDAVCTEWIYPQASVIARCATSVHARSVPFALLKPNYVRRAV